MTESKDVAVTGNRIVYDMSNADYHAHPAISKSGLDKIAQSPAHYKYYKENGSDETKAMTFGSAFHTMILEPEKVADSLIVLPDEWLTKAQCGKTIADQKEEFLFKHQHKTIISTTEMDTAKGMAAAIEAHAAARFILRKSPGKAEPSLFWRNEELGVDCRARFDWVLENGLIVDLKTCQCAKPEIFDRSALDFRYHVQAAFYMEAYRQVFKSEPAGFAFIAVEKSPPYPVCVYLATPDFIELGVRHYKRDLMLYAECMQKNEWPAYPDVSLVPLNLPKWAQSELEKGE